MPVELDLNHLKADEQRLVQDMYKNYKELTAGQDITIESMRQADLEQRYVKRKQAYQTVMMQFLSKYNTDHEIEALSALFEFFEAVFVGCDMPRIGTLTSNRKPWTYYDSLAKYLTNNFKVMGYFLEVLQAVFQEKLPLPEVLYEAIDPQHRPGSKLWNYSQKDWDQSLGFYTFYGMKTSGQNHVTYLTCSQDQRPFQATFANEGTIFWQDNVADTTQAKGKQDGYYAFALLSDGTFLVHPHKQGAFQHSSFTGCAGVACVGMVKIENGKIIAMNNHSGHYRPSVEDFRKVLTALPAEAFAPGAVITTEVNAVPAVRDFCMSSDWGFLRQLGHYTRDIVNEYKFVVGSGDNTDMLLARYDSIVPSSTLVTVSDDSCVCTESDGAAPSGYFGNQ